jgi:hypothetical protein
MALASLSGDHRGVKAILGVALAASAVLFVAGVALRRADDALALGSVGTETIGILLMLLDGLVGFFGVLLWPIERRDDRLDRGP